MHRPFTISVAAALIAAGAANAQSVPVASRAQLTGPTIDWGTTSPGDASSFNATVGTYTVTTSTTDGFLRGLVAGSSWGGGFIDGQNLLYTTGSNMMFDFSSPIYGFGTQTWFNLGNGTLSFSTYLNNVLSGTFVYATGGSFAENANQATFFGVENPLGFDRVVITTVTNESDSPQFAINDVTLSAQFSDVGPVPVPEPASLVLLGTGLSGLAGFARRRRIA